MHTGEQYHTFMLSSPRDKQVRERFQRMALDLLAPGEDVLDFGAGTGIDAKVFAANGHRTFAYEPSRAMSKHLKQYCQDEIANKTVITIESPLVCKVHAAISDFAVLNHFASHTHLFEELSRVIEHGGFFLGSFLSPYYLGDARCGWWQKNLLNLVWHGHYAIPSESGVHRFTPRVVAQSAAPYFRLERITPRGLGLAADLYMFLLFRRL